MINRLDKAKESERGAESTDRSMPTSRLREGDLRKSQHDSVRGTFSSSEAGKSFSLNRRKETTPEVLSAPQSVALVCDWLTEKGGAEKVLLELHHLYPDAPIYTSQYRPKRIDWFKDATVKTGWLNILPARLRRIIGPLRQRYFSHLDLSHYDLVISVTGAEAKSVRTTPRAYHTVTQKGKYEVVLPPHPRTTHICYCHVPTQYYWHSYDRYLKNPGFGFLNPVVRFFFRLFVKPLRKADYEAAQRPDYFVTISNYAAEQIQKYYHREATVIYPPVDTAKFAKSPQNSTTPVTAAEPPFVISCRQVTWKRVDLAISACNRLGLPLQVIGDGPEHAKLVKLAADVPARDVSHVEFVPWLPADQLAAHLQSARAFIFPSLEPFGIAPVEALAAGCPVIAFDEGGSRDFVHPGENGLFFHEQTVESLASVLQEFPDHHLDRTLVSASAEPFDVTNFRQGITDFIEQALSQPLPEKSPTTSASDPKDDPNA